MKSKKLFNSTGNSKCEIIGCDTDGVIDFVHPTHKWAKSLWDVMLSNTWFPSEVDVGQDKRIFENLPEEDKQRYLRCLSQLIVNDSIQTNQLMDGYNRYITDPLVNAVIARQAFEEALHSQSYARLGEEILPPVLAEYLYQLHKTNVADYDKELAEKNQAVADMFAPLYKDGDDITEENLLLGAGANQVLERMVFPSGFVTMWAFGEKGMVGSAKMISFIERDEDTHVALFKNIFRTIVREKFGSMENVPNYIKDQLIDLIKRMTEVEIKWTKTLTKGMLGFSDKAIESYIQSKANEVCTNLMLPELYKIDIVSPLKSLEEKWSLIKGADTRTAFFENKVADYAKGDLDFDDV